MKSSILSHKCNCDEKENDAQLINGCKKEKVVRENLWVLGMNAFQKGCWKETTSHSLSTRKSIECWLQNKTRPKCTTSCTSLSMEDHREGSFPLFHSSTTTQVQAKHAHMQSTYLPWPQVFVYFLIISQMSSETPRKLQVCASPMATRICNICKEIHDSRGMLNLSQLALSLAGLSKLERKQIKETYKVMYGENMADLLQRIQLLGNQRNDVLDSQKLCTALSVWMLDSHERDATFAREAIEQGDTNYKALVEIFVGRKSSHIMLMKQAYQVRFRRQLDQDIINLEPPHPYQKILVALSTSHKANQVDVSQHIAKCDAMRLYEAGEGGSRAIDESVVLEILSKRSIPLMKLTFCSYKHIYGHEYTKSLKIGNSKDFETTLRTVIKCMCNPTSYYAKALQVSIQAADTGDLSRMIMSRAEVDMNEIQGVLQKKYGTKLRDAICERFPSGDYTDFLVALATKATTTN